MSKKRIGKKKIRKTLNFETNVLINLKIVKGKEKLKSIFTSTRNEFFSSKKVNLYFEINVFNVL